MPKNENNIPGGTPLGNPGGDSSLTEIDFDSFLNDYSDKPAPAQTPADPAPVPADAFFNPQPAEAPSESDSVLDELNSLLGELHAGTKVETDALGSLLGDIASNEALAQAEAEARAAAEQQSRPAPAPAIRQPAPAAPAPVPEAKQYKEITVDDEIDDLGSGSFLDREPVPPQALLDVLAAQAPVPPAPTAPEPAPEQSNFRYFKPQPQPDSVPNEQPMPIGEPAPMPYAAKAPKVTKDKPSKGEKSDGDKKPSAIFPAKGDSTSEIIRKLVLLVSMVTIVVSAGVLVNTYLFQPSLSKNQMEKAQGDIITGDGSAIAEEASKIMQENNSITFPEGMLPKYAKLYAANTDMAGWISIPGMDINFPLAKGADNDEYLTRDIYGKRVKYGVPFFDYRNNLKTLNRNTIVYGHNMRYDDMIFGLLENYTSIGGFEDAPVIECNTIYGDYKWKVYAVFITNADPKDDNGNVFAYNFIDHNDTAFMEYIDMVDERKLYSTGVDIQSTDKILTLSTCFYEFNDARLVVVARLVRDGESADVDTSLAVKNENAHYPQAWYDVHNKSNPYA